MTFHFLQIMTALPILVTFSSFFDTFGRYFFYLLNILQVTSQFLPVFLDFLTIFTTLNLILMQLFAVNATFDHLGYFSWKGSFQHFWLFC